MIGLVVFLSSLGKMCFPAWKTQSKFLTDPLERSQPGLLTTELLLYLGSPPRRRGKAQRGGGPNTQHSTLASRCPLSCRSWPWRLQLAQPVMP